MTPPCAPRAHRCRTAHASHARLSSNSGFEREETAGVLRTSLHLLFHRLPSVAPPIVPTHAQEDGVTPLALSRVVRMRVVALLAFGQKDEPAQSAFLVEAHALRGSN
jgi:hypothetical protein